MAALRTYKCECCGYEVQSEPLGHYSLMMGEFYNFSCPKSKEIVSIAAQILAAQRYSIECPECGNDSDLSTWNPIDGKCPKCNGHMSEQEGYIIMAD